MEYDRYFKSQEHVYDVTVVEYRGRGHDHFHDEILRIFDWMGRKERNFFPKYIQAVSMRPFDNYFWWLETSDPPAKAMKEPDEFPLPNGYQPARLDATIQGNAIKIKSSFRKSRVWLTPDMVDFQQPLRVTVNGKLLKTPSGAVAGPDLLTLLEDVRTRGERRRPFWLKIE
jgi:hypothetical protein